MEQAGITKTMNLNAITTVKKMNKVLIKGENFELNKTTFGIGLIVGGVIMMFFPQTNGVGPFVIGFGIGMTGANLSRK